MTPKKRTAAKASPTETTHVFLALDPETRRVLVQNHEFGESDFPPGLRGAGWPTREHDVPVEQFEGVLAGKYGGGELDRLHRDWWDQARPEGEPLWPNVP